LPPDALFPARWGAAGRVVVVGAATSGKGKASPERHVREGHTIDMSGI
jgi:hypothetical protein